MLYQAEITKKEAIRRIEEVYHAGYDPDTPDFDAFEQLLVCESIAESETTAEKQSYNSPAQEKQLHPSENVGVSGMVNDIYKRNANFELTENKQKVIAELKTLSYITPPIKIAQLLKTLFAEYNSRDGWWLYVSQHWNPRAINRVIKRMIELQSSGRITIQNPAAYFTYLIQFRKKRRSL